MPLLSALKNNRKTAKGIIEIAVGASLIPFTAGWLSFLQFNVLGMTLAAVLAIFVVVMGYEKISGKELI